DFILSYGKPSRLIQTPIFSLVEAKRQDLELGLGQCVAQMVGAQIVNQKHHHTYPVIYGCVTTGELWQFLQLEGTVLSIDLRTYALNSELPLILGILQTICDRIAQEVLIA
ncbi:MAG: hypothetical protein VKJ24_20505, partial [Synechococcales bacterium]|nr:hypothetical protein [Synechococcales bacterium]